MYLVLFSNIFLKRHSMLNTNFLLRNKGKYESMNVSLNVIKKASKFVHDFLYLFFKNLLWFKSLSILNACHLDYYANCFNCVQIRMILTFSHWSKGMLFCKSMKRYKEVVYVVTAKGDYIKYGIYENTYCIERHDW